ncbi:MAG TPA: hypothetical protein VF682_13185 [Pseudomonas sp.]
MGEEEQGHKLDTACPKCGVSPLTFTLAKPIESFEDFQDKPCASCGKSLSKEEIEGAMKKAMDK